MDHGIGEVTNKERRWMGRLQEDGGDRVAEAVPVPEEARAEAGGPVAHVRYGLGVTLNMGDYRSVRVDVSVDLPCKVSKKSIETVHDFAKGWCENKINGEIADWTGDTAVKSLPDGPDKKRR